MDEKINPAEDHPIPATDQASEETSSQEPTAAADKGVSATVQENESTLSEATPSTPTPSGSAAGEPAETPVTDSESEETSSLSSDLPSDPSDVTPPESLAAEATEVDAAAGTDALGTAVSADAPEAGAPDIGETVEAAPAATEESAAGAQAEGEGLTMEDVLAASDEQLGRKPVHRGLITTGTIIMLSQEGIVVDVGAKIEGILPYNQLFEFEVKPDEAAKYFKAGDSIQVYVIRADIPNNVIVLSKKRADQERAWNLLQEIHDKQKPVEVEIVEKVRGGLVANLGIRAFLPASQVDVRRVSDLSPYVNKRAKVKIIELNRKRNRVIISRRAIIEEEIAEKKHETLQKLEPGLKLDGEIVEITDFGAFVNLGGIDGLVHRSELSHGRFNHPRDVVKVGDKVKVEVLDMDLERERINLSMKKLIPNPWENVLTTYTIGQKVQGDVTNLTPFGAFVEIEPGLEGLIHVSEMSWTKRVRHPKEVLTEGDSVEALILKIDTSQERISLGLRQTQPDPWSSLPDRFPPGTEVTGPITGLTDFGVFMEIEEGIEGLIHISELAHEHIEDVAEHFNKGDEVTAVILNIDPVEQRASLSRKRLLPFTASEYEAPVGAGQGGSPRKGRRGGRRSQGIDYDYSYAVSDGGGKTTTKLGDVYADLFAQFGLADTKEAAQPSSEGEQGTAPQETAAAAEATATAADTLEQASEEISTDKAAPSDESDGVSASAATEETEATPQAEMVEAVAEVKEEIAQDTSEEIDAENAIDAVEAAAMLTAAFREGKRPQKSPEEAQVEGETQAASSSDGDELSETESS
ncbi:MAG: 30S ribosomal protein S1 [Trueperaceae bacterium]|nr:MAG: 30S ribosomal protein S1 [Trueperaceae bacterium]